jgi:hypothetical protein
METDSDWTAFVDETGMPETVGTDGGAILLDDEHPMGARITLEKDSCVAPFSITSGIYGWMVHTRHFQQLDVARDAFAAMKPELVAILDLIPVRSDPDAEAKVDIATAAMSAFVDRFP